MKKLLVIVLLLQGITLNLFSQVTKAPVDVAENPYRLEWLRDESGRISFRNAEHPDFFHGLPALAIQEKNEIVSASLSNARYEIMDQASASPISEYIGPEPLVNVMILESGKNRHSMVYVMPFRRNVQSGQIERLISFGLDLSSRSFSNLPVKRAATASAFSTQSVLSSGDWYRFTVHNDGIYALSFTDLSSLGIIGSAIPTSSLRLFGNGGGMVPLANSTDRPDDLLECAIEVADLDNDGFFGEGDQFFFYGQGPDRWSYKPTEKQYIHQKHLFSDSTYYYLTLSDTGTPKRIVPDPGIPAQPDMPLVTSFTDVAFHEEDIRNFIKSGRNWYGEAFDVTLSQRFSFTFPNLIPGTVRLRSNVAARTSTSTATSSRFVVSYNNSTVLTHTVPNVGTSYTDDFARTSFLKTTFQAGAGPDLSLTYTFQPYNASSSGWLDYISINALRELRFTGNQLFFRDEDSLGNGSNLQRTYRIEGVDNSLRLWNISQHNNVRSQQFSLNAQTAEFSQNVPLSGQANYALFNENAILKPAYSGPIQNQNLHGLQPAQYLIITPSFLIPEAERLAEFHRTEDNLSAHVVSLESIYHEFSSGAQDISAIRDFIRMFHMRHGGTPDALRYVLLFGDGSYDHKDRVSGNSNLIPTFQSENSVSLLISYTSDDFYTMLDDGEGTLVGPELPDVGIGRIPIKTLEQAREQVDKIIRYSTPGEDGGTTNCAGNSTLRLGDWRNALCFIADDQDRNLHLRQSERMLAVAQQFSPASTIDKIVLDAYNQVSTPGGPRYPDVNEAIDRRIQKGALLVNYTGHGGELGWASEAILNNDMINSWSNTNTLPAFITATCEFSRYDDPQRTAAGEFVLLNASGGGICLFTTVRLAFAIENELINSNMIKRMFTPLNGEMPRAGDIIRLSKTDNPSNRNVTLLGDPALRLSYPKHKVNTTAIEEASTGLPADTLRSLNKITIRGRIEDQNGNPLNSFNGLIYPTVFDKSGKVYTLVNDQSGSDISLLDSFMLRSNTLYKGKASVRNGEFSCTFIVPKDISIQYGSGRISYYAHNGSEDAQGVNESIVIGGIGSLALSDNAGPEIRLYMNDEGFVPGSMTSPNPLVYAILTDSSGINTVGNGIGHDITAQLDGKPNLLYVLNDFYESDLDSYQQGKVRFPLEGLSEGTHTLVLKAWDINNNSSEQQIEFVVASSERLALDRVLNYPNPFTTRTTFLFEHNKPCEGMAVQVQVFTISGKLVKTLDSYQICEGFRNSPLEWDGRDDFGDPLGKGVYVYRLKVRTADGETAQKTEKLVLLR
ncbi:MAG: type IX secretion system sortase PorU [Bacteroidota bacterium]